MTTLVLAQNTMEQSLEVTSRLINAALALDENVHAVVIESDAQTSAGEIAQLAGVTQVLKLVTPKPGDKGFDEIAHALRPLMEEYDALITQNMGAGRHILPLLAAQLHIAPLTGISAILDQHRFERPLYAGSLIEQISNTAKKNLLSIRTAHFDPVGSQSACPIISHPFQASCQRVEIIEHIKTSNDRPELIDASRVVAGGRGLGSADGFRKLERLADQLGAALGASRIAVDMGWAPHHLQVGQTGVQIAPDLYIALGISGAIQHIAGIKDAGAIIAINKDRDAPIFKVANYGMIGDLHTLLPFLQKALAEDKS